MLRVIKNIFWKAFIAVDAKLKFPALKRGETAIQAGFDMSAPLTSDLFLLCRKTGSTGHVIGIEPDTRNISAANILVQKNKLPVQFIHKALFDKQGKMSLLLGEKASWNQLSNVPIDTGVPLTNESIEIEMDTLDHILEQNNIAIPTIGHINLTINGAEYGALKGMHRLLSEATNIGITIVAGRYDASGTIDGKPDQEVLIALLKGYGFNVTFRRMHQLFWWGFMVNTVLKRKWIYGKKNYGIIMAAKGNKQVRWYQSFS